MALAAVHQSRQVKLTFLEMSCCHEPLKFASRLRDKVFRRVLPLCQTGDGQLGDFAYDLEGVVIYLHFRSRGNGFVAVHRAMSDRLIDSMYDRRIGVFDLHVFVFLPIFVSPSLGKIHAVHIIAHSTQ